MDRLHNGQNFEKFRNSKIHYYSIKEHLKLSKIAKFGCEMLKNVNNITLLYYARKIDTIFSIFIFPGELQVAQNYGVPYYHNG